MKIRTHSNTDSRIHVHFSGGNINSLCRNDIANSKLDFQILLWYLYCLHYLFFFPPNHSDGEQMQYASCDQWFPALKGPCEIASPSHFQMLIERFNWITFQKHCLNSISFCSLWLCFSYLYEKGCGRLSDLSTGHCCLGWHHIQVILQIYLIFLQPNWS